MSKLKRRVESQLRISELEKAFINTIEDLSNKHPNLTMNEVGAAMLKLLTDANDSEIKEATS